VSSRDGTRFRCPRRGQFGWHLVATIPNEQGACRAGAFGVALAS
jgi:hypothetical protein